MRAKVAGIWLSDLMSFWILATMALCMGLVTNQLKDKPLPLVYQTKAERMGIETVAEKDFQSKAPSISLPSGEISLSDFKKLVDQGSVLILDARPEVFHRISHIPGAISLPRDDFRASYEKLKDRLEKDKSQKIIVYCAGSSCEDSRMVQAALIKLGYGNVTVFRGGWSEWSAAGLPEEKAL